MSPQHEAHVPLSIQININIDNMFIEINYILHLYILIRWHFFSGCESRRVLSVGMVAMLAAWSWAAVGSLLYLAMKPEEWWQGMEFLGSFGPDTLENLQNLGTILEEFFQKKSERSKKFIRP